MCVCVCVCQPFSFIRKHHLILLSYTILRKAKKTYLGPSLSSVSDIYIRLVSQSVIMSSKSKSSSSNKMYQFRVVFVGDQGSGKTSIIRRLVSSKRSPYETTTVSDSRSLLRINHTHSFIHLLFGYILNLDMIS